MSQIESRRVVLVKRPEGVPTPDCFAVEAGPLPSPGESQVLVEVTHLSIDPAMRAWVDAESYMGAVRIGETMRALGVGRVLESRDPRLAVGDVVHGPLGVQEHALLPGGFLRKIEDDRVPPSAWVGALGLTGGLTAYFGILDVGPLREGDRVLVSGAAGAVGSLAGQIARLCGAGEVVGIAGGARKQAYVVDELGFDACIDYKAEDVHAAIGQRLPDGVDLYFDNVGGEILDDALAHLAEDGRVVVCGAISQYNARKDGRVTGPSRYLRIAEKNASMSGFVVTKFQDRFAEAEARLCDWLASGDIVLPEHVEKGVENFHATFMKLFDGSHIGKLLLAP